jgi:predicted ATP-grasp superfamily ATP-dependent carboligase
MHSPLPATSANRGEILIAALSGRALAEAAVESGYRPLVADLFGDEDTREMAQAVKVVDGDLETGFSGQALLDALDRLSAGRRPVGIVYGSGFEADPGLLAALAERWPLLGNAPQTVSRLKDPIAFAALCARFDIPHPETALQTSDEPGQWLRKQRGGSGGSHIQAATAVAGERFYFQRRIDGIPVSALFLADGRKALIAGWSRQWCAPSPDEPYRYGGAARPCGLRDEMLQPAEREIAALTAELGLKGLNGADYIFAGGRHWLLEINPRPGASLDVFRGLDLFQAHIDACRGELQAIERANGRASAAAIVYAGKAIASVPAVTWPEWVRDRQSAGTSVRPGEPLCTVMAEAETAIDAIAMVQARTHLIRGQIEARAA